MSLLPGHKKKRTRLNARHADPHIRIGYDQGVFTDLYSTSLAFNIDHIPNCNLFSENSLIYGRVQTQLIRAPGCFETNDDVRNGLSITAQWILSLCWREFGDLALVDIFCLFDSEPCR